MVKKVKITIDKIAYGGSGIGRFGDVVVFVPFSAPGDELSVKITEEKKNYWTGEIDKIITLSPERVHPPCPYFTGCGGCQFQHLNYKFQSDVKKTMIEDALQRLAKISVVVSEPLGMTEPYHYRNKTQYPLDGKHGIRIGYYERSTHHVIDIDACLIHPPEFDQLAQFFRSGIKKSQETIYSEADQIGNLRHLIIRKGFNTGECLLTIVTRTDRLAPEIYKEIDRVVPGIVGVIQNINPDRTNRILGSRFAILAGKDFYFETVRDKKFRISAGSFFQVNTAQTEVLLETVINFLKPAGTEQILDLFCGVGTIGITLAPLVKNVTGIEIDQAAVADGIENLKLNGITNMEFLAGPVETLVEKSSRADAVVVDPPRKGCDAQLLRAIARLNPEKIIYVSCNPTTLARDLTILSPLGYVATEIQPIDLFPQTYHIEAVAKIEKASRA